MAIGDHLRVWRGLYWHHGIDLGDGEVVQYSGLADGLRAGPVNVVALAEFAQGAEVALVSHRNRRYDGAQTVRRALSRVGESNYSVAFNNCEHFCRWAVDGVASSDQVQRSAIRALVGTAVVLMSGACAAAALVVAGDGADVHGSDSPARVRG